MNRSRALAALATAALSVSVLTACGESGESTEEEVRIAEPVLDFPQTSTTATPTPTTTAAADDEEDEDEETETSESTTTATTTTTSSSSRSSSTTSSRSSSSGSRSGSRSGGGTTIYQPAPAPAPAPQVEPDQPGAACPWPTQGNASGNQEYSTFCDREWARTVTPEDSQDYYWVAKGNGWVSVDPDGQAPDGGVCWNRQDFNNAPEAIRNAVTFCEVEVE